MIELFTPEQVREADARVIAAGTPSLTLMERAAGHLARAAVGLGGRGYGLRVGVLCGKGSNGGDGFAAARRLRDAGASVVVHAALGTELDGDAGTNARRWLAEGGRMASSVEEAAGAEVVLDCLLGTGASGEPRGEIATSVAAVEDHPRVVACDTPTGVDATTGRVPGAAVRAAVTVALGQHKVGLWLWPARGRCGRMVLGDLGFDRLDPAADDPVARVLEAPDVMDLVGTLAPDAHKRTRGVVALVAGSPGMAGAAVLAAKGALAAGAGLVSVAVDPALAATITGAVPEALVWELPSAGSAGGDARADSILERLDGVDAVAIGPGLGLEPETQTMVRRLVAEIEVPVVLDADGLNTFRDDGAALADHAAALLVLTPHARELARLVGSSGHGVWAQRLEVVPAQAERWGATVLAKGPGTLVAAPDGQMWVTATGSAALATGGTGDVLTGIAGTLVAQRPGPGSVAAAAWLHGRAGELAADAAGDPRAVSASGVAAALGAAFAEVNRSRWGTSSGSAGG